MTIGIDIRCLLGEKHTGVGEYTMGLLRSLFLIDSKNKYNKYKLFCNSFRKNKIIDIFRNFKNVKVYNFRYPNKLLNFSLKYLRFPRIDKLIGGVDLFFSPNVNFLSLSSSCKKVITFHDLSFERYPEFFSKKRQLWHKFINPRSLAEHSDLIIAVSNSTKNDLIQIYNIDSQKIKVIFSGIDKSFQPISDKNCLDIIRNKYKLPEKFILYLGTIEPRKNIEGLILAFNKLRQNSKIKHKLVIAGEKGWLYKQIFNCASKINYKDDIIFTGFIEDKDKPAVYNLAEVFVYPSFYEGFGFPPLEAMACGTPVITSSVSSLPEIIDNAGLLVDPYNINEITEAMMQVILDKHLRESFREKGLERVKEFGWERCAKEMLREIESQI